MKKLMILFSVAIVLGACESKKIKAESESGAKLFFSYLKQGDEEKLKRLYKGFANFETYFKSDSAKIKSTIYKNDIVMVTVHNRFTNGLGKLSEKDIFLFFRKDSIGKLSLYDSKGLSDFMEKNDYKFGIKTGCITTNDTTDQQILSALKKSNKVLMDKGIDVYLELLRDVHVTNWSWEELYSGSASGKGIVVNNSRFDIPSLNYTVTFKSSSGATITTDKGVVSYDAILAGGSTSFSFYTDYIGNATRASIELNFDDELILNYLANKEWTGKECEEYFKAHPATEKKL